MIIWLRNIVVIFVLLSVVYVVLSAWSRAKQRNKLNAEYAVKNPADDKDEFVAKGMRKYDRSLKPKLIFSVYLVPLFISGVLIYLAQHT